MYPNIRIRIVKGEKKKTKSYKNKFIKKLPNSYIF